MNVDAHEEDLVRILKRAFRKGDWDAVEELRRKNNYNAAICTMIENYTSGMLRYHYDRSTISGLNSRWEQNYSQRWGRTYTRGLLVEIATNGTSEIMASLEECLTLRERKYLLQKEGDIRKSYRDSLQCEIIEVVKQIRNGKPSFYKALLTPFLNTAAGNLNNSLIAAVLSNSAIPGDIIAKFEPLTRKNPELSILLAQHPNAPKNVKPVDFKSSEAKRLAGRLEQLVKLNQVLCSNVNSPLPYEGDTLAKRISEDVSPLLKLIDQTVDISKEDYVKKLRRTTEAKVDFLLKGLEGFNEALAGLVTSTSFGQERKTQLESVTHYLEGFVSLLEEENGFEAIVSLPALKVETDNQAARAKEQIRF